jgi:hypothetical protein
MLVALGLLLSSKFVGRPEHESRGINRASGRLFTMMVFAIESVQPTLVVIFRDTVNGAAALNIFDGLGPEAVFPSPNDHFQLVMELPTGATELSAKDVEAFWQEVKFTKFATGALPAILT